MSIDFSKVTPEATFSVLDSTKIQMLSLTNFMAALGYEEVHDLHRGLIAFAQPAFASVGKARVSVNSAIRMHNELAEETHAMLHFSPYMEFKEFIAQESNVDSVIALFAGSCKIVQTVKATFSRKKGIMIQGHSVKFMTRKDERQYESMFGK
jgi:hypothetical protein